MSSTIDPVDTKLELTALISVVRVWPVVIRLPLTSSITDPPASPETIPISEV